MIRKSFLNVWSLKNFQNWPALRGLSCTAEHQGVLFSCGRALRIFKARPGNGESIIINKSKKEKRMNGHISGSKKADLQNPFKYSNSKAGS